MHPKSRREVTTYLKNLIRRIIRRRAKWSIGIYAGSSPFTLQSGTRVNNPVLTAKDVSDFKAHMVADPFMVFENGTWYMFFEAMNDFESRGVIGLATSEDGLSWQYQKIILNESFHLSYPYVFKHNGHYYMIPESHQEKSVRLYKALNFPDTWVFIKELLTGDSYVDSSVLFFDQRWWLFTCLTSNDTLQLYFSDDLMGDWIEHPKSPVVQNNLRIARPGGRVLLTQNRIIRYAQNDEFYYGSQVNVVEIKTLTPTEYHEEEFAGNPLLEGG